MDDSPLLKFRSEEIILNFLTNKEKQIWMNEYFNSIPSNLKTK